VGIALALTLGLSACGSGSSSPSNQTATFKSGLAPVLNQFKLSSQAIGMAIQGAPSQTDAQIASTFKGLAGTWQSHVSTLETLKPPANLATEFNTLTSAAAAAESDLNAIVAASLTHSASAAKQASATLVTDILNAKSAATTLTNKLGIK
jgi:hypothetical protein